MNFNDFLKVVSIFGTFGALRRQEIHDIELNHIETTSNNSFLVRIPKTKTHKQRIFAIVGDDFIKVVQKYMKLRPASCDHNALFVNYKDKKCTRQRVGLNTIGHIPTKIATFLELEEPHLYTGHCFRRSSASILAETGATTREVQDHGGWSSPRVAEGYCEASISTKDKRATKIMGSGFRPLCLPSSSVSSSTIDSSDINGSSEIGMTKTAQNSLKISTIIGNIMDRNKSDQVATVAINSKEKTQISKDAANSFEHCSNINVFNFNFY